MTQSILQRKYYLTNKKKILEHNRRYYQKNKHKIRIWNLQYQKSRYRNDIIYKLKRNLRRRFLLALQGKKKDKSVIRLLGCSVEELKKHLESKFQTGMSWENRHKWHIDHIKSCASFDFSRPEQQAECFHYSNLQPLWIIDNLKKGAR